jgi:uncharacterized coiled-coil protein SlyX
LLFILPFSLQISPLKAIIMPNKASGKDAESRQLKKREQDRKSQKSARERTKKRIAELERTVEALRQDNSSTLIITLTDELKEVTRDRDRLLKVLERLSSTIRDVTNRSRTTSEPPSDIGFESSEHAEPSQPIPGKRVSPNTASETSNSTIPKHPMNHPPDNTLTDSSWMQTTPYGSTAGCDFSGLTMSGLPLDMGFGYQNMQTRCNRYQINACLPAQQQKRATNAGEHN